MNNLHRELAPISEAAWADLEAEARRTFVRRFSARSGPTSQRTPTWRNPGSPPPIRSDQCWKTVADVFAVRVRKSIA